MSHAITALYPANRDPAMQAILAYIRQNGSRRKRLQRDVLDRLAGRNAAA